MIMGVLSSCGSVAELTPPKYLPNDYPKGTVYPKINKPINKNDSVKQDDSN